jgi:hypothetical protein
MKYLLRSLSIVAFILLSLLGSAQAQQIAIFKPTPYLGEIFPISQLNNLKLTPAVAYSPQHHEYLVVWENEWPGNHDIYGQRVSEHGELLSWFAISAGEHDRIEPAVAYDPTRDRYLVVWAFDFHGDGSDFDIVGRFVSWDGVLGNETYISDSTNGEYHPQVAYGLSQDVFTVVWISDTAADPSFITARQVWAENGTFPGTTFVVSQGADNRDSPDIAYNLHRNEWLVVWDQWVSTDLDIYAVRLAGDGTVIGGGIFAIYATAKNEEKTSVAACHLLDQYLVVFEKEYSNPPVDIDIWARYVSGDGIPGASYEVDATTTKQLEPDVACSSAGNSYLIAWKDEFTDGYYGILAREAGADGFPRVATIMVQPGTFQHRFDPAVGGGSSQFLVTWVHGIYRNLANYHDIYGRTYTPYVVFLPFLKN